MTRDDVDRSNRLERGLAVLQAFRPDGRPLRLTDITVRVGFAKSTTHRLVNDLLRLGFLERQDDEFVLGHAVFELGDGETAVAVAEPFGGLTSRVEWRQSSAKLAALADETCEHLAAALDELEQDARAFATLGSLVISPIAQPVRQCSVAETATPVSARPEVGSS